MIEIAQKLKDWLLDYQIHPAEQNPAFRYGTPLKTSAENAYDFPSRVLYLPLPTRMTYGKGIYRENTADVQLHLLRTANFGDWDTEDYFEERLNEMLEWAEAFCDAISKPRSPFNNSDSQFEVVAIPKWGRYNEKGAFTNIFNKNLTGVKISGTLKFSTCN